LVVISNKLKKYATIAISTFATQTHVTYAPPLAGRPIGQVNSNERQVTKLDTLLLIMGVMYLMNSKMSL
jgi:hypothetical protein